MSQTLIQNIKSLHKIGEGPDADQKLMEILQHKLGCVSDNSETLADVAECDLKLCWAQSTRDAWAE